MAREREADPYTESGSFAVVQVRSRERRDVLLSSLADADELEARGHRLLARSKRRIVQGVALLFVAGCAAGWLGYTAVTAADGSYVGALRGNWSMLGCVLAVAALNFIWGWIGVQRRFRETGRRLLTRAEYQRRLAALQLQEVDHEAVP
jgi:hypothetical protein